MRKVGLQSKALSSQKPKHMHGFSSMKIIACHKEFPFTVSVLQLLEKLSFWAPSSTAWLQPGGPSRPGVPAMCALCVRMRYYVQHTLHVSKQGAQKQLLHLSVSPAHTPNSNPSPDCNT